MSLPQSLSLRGFFSHSLCQLCYLAGYSAHLFGGFEQESSHEQPRGDGWSVECDSQHAVAGDVEVDALSAVDSCASLKLHGFALGCVFDEEEVVHAGSCERTCHLLSDGESAGVSCEEFDVDAGFGVWVDVFEEVFVVFYYCFLFG